MSRMSTAVRAVVPAGIAMVAVIVVAVAAPLPLAETGPALVVPVMFTLAGLLGPIWRGSGFTCTAVAGIGVLHLVALAASALALADVGPGSVWHVTGQVAFVAGFGVLVPLAAGYPAGPAPAWSLGVLGLGVLIPVLAAFAGPTPAVLDGTTMLGPVAPLLPDWIASASGIVFVLPAAAVAVGVVRLIRGGRALRRRLTWPLAALAAMAVIVAAGAALQTTAEGLTAALFLAASPLVPVGLMAGARVDADADADAEARMLRRELQAIAARLEAASRTLPGESAAAVAPTPARAPRPPGMPAPTTVIRVSHASPNARWRCSPSSPPAAATPPSAANSTSRSRPSRSTSTRSSRSSTSSPVRTRIAASRRASPTSAIGAERRRRFGHRLPRRFGCADAAPSSCRGDVRRGIRPSRGHESATAFAARSPDSTAPFRNP